MKKRFDRNLTFEKKCNFNFYSSCYTTAEFEHCTWTCESASQVHDINWAPSSNLLWAYSIVEYMNLVFTVFFGYTYYVLISYIFWSEKKCTHFIIGCVHSYFPIFVSYGLDLSNGILGEQKSMWEIGWPIKAVFHFWAKFCNISLMIFFFKSRHLDCSVTYVMAASII